MLQRNERSCRLYGFKMITFTPPPSFPRVIEMSRPEYGAEPTSVESHGYHYFVTGNTVLAPALIEKTLAREETPREAISALLHVYYSKGYNLVALTAQTEGRTVRISVFQGMFTEIQTPDSLGCYFSSLKNQENVRNQDIILDQILAGAYASRSGKNISINISPAPNPGGAILAVRETDQPGYFPITGSVNFGNYGSRYASGYLAGADVAANATHGVQITANFLQGLPSLQAASFGGNYYQNGVGASMVTPYGIYGVSTAWTHYRLGVKTAPLNPDGNIFSYQTYGTQLVYADTAIRLSLNEAFYRVQYDETAFNGYYTLLKQQYNYLSVGGNASQAVTFGGLPGSVTAGVTFSLGISGSSGTLTDNEPGVPTSHFRYTNFNLGYQQNLPYGLQANLVGQAQASAQTLPSQQQWVLGGMGNLSAWDPGVLYGDSGYIGRFELKSPSVTKLRTTAVLGAFIETGGAAFRTPPAGTAPWQTLTDIGLNLKLTLPYGLSAIAITAVEIDNSGFTASEKHNLTLNRTDAFFVVQKSI